MRLDGNSALAFKVHGVQHLGRHLALSQSSADLNKTVGKRRLTMVNMGNDREVTDQTQVAHSRVLPDVVARQAVTGDSPENSQQVYLISTRGAIADKKGCQRIDADTLLLSAQLERLFS